MRGATASCGTARPWWPVSIHAPHARGDCYDSGLPTLVTMFQSTPLMRGATRRAAQGARQSRFQSTPLMRGATRAHEQVHGLAHVSIHAPHARGDSGDAQQAEPETVSIHAPHARGDHVESLRVAPREVSIHAPHARGDARGSSTRRQPRGFNPRPSCEGRHLVGDGAVVADGVSIHAPHARGDPPRPRSRGRAPSFNPRPSCEGRRAHDSSAA